MVEKTKTPRQQVVEKVETDITSQKKENKKIDFENLSFWTIATLVFLVPLFVLPSSVLGISQTKMSLIALGTLLAFCFLVIDRMKKGVVTFSLNPVYVSAALLSLTYFVSGWIGVSQYKSLIGSMTEQDTFVAISIGFLFMFILSRVAHTPRKVFTILSFLFGSIVVAMFFQLGRILFGDYFSLGVLTSPSLTLAGGWGDMTILSLLLLSALVIVLETVKLKKWVATVLGVVLVIPFLFVILSGLSFDFYFFGIGLLLLIAIASIVIFAYLFSLRKSHQSLEGAENVIIKKKTKLSASLIMLLVSILLVLFGAQANLYLSNLTGVVYVEGRPNWQSTFSIASKVLSQKPFFGSGPNTFDLEWNLNRSAEVNNYIFWNNDYNFGVGFVPTALITVGLIGFVLWILFYGFVFMLSFKSLFGLNKKEDSTVMGVVVSVGSILSSLMMVFYAPGIVVVMVNLVFISLLIALNSTHRKTWSFNLHTKQWKNFVSTIGFVILLIVTIYIMYIVAFKALANIYYRSAVLSNNLDSALASIQRAIILDPTQPLYYQTMAQVYASKVDSIMSLSQSEFATKKDELNSTIVNAINASVYAEQISPNDYKSKLVTGKILEYFGTGGLKDASQGAIQKYAAASLLIPANPLPHLFAANVALSINDKVLAKEHLTKAIELKSDYSDAPELGKQIQALVDQLNKSSSGSINSSAVSSTTKTKEKTK